MYPTEGCVAVSTERSVSSAVSSLSDGVDRIAELVANLGGQLKPVLRPDTDGAEKDGIGPGCPVPLAERISISARKLATVERGLLDLLDRLEL